MIEAYVIALIIAKLKGYKISPNAILKDWSLYPAFICLILYIVLQYAVFTGHYGVLVYSKYFKFFYVMVFLVPVLKHRLAIVGIIASCMMMVGMMLNSVVMKYNSGYMPVYPTLSKITGYVRANTFAASYDSIHILGDKTTHLKILTDWIDIGYCILSPGDVFTRVYAGIILYSVIKLLSHKNVEGEK
jgi:hypothetical protein